jgi:hypothetical protein
LAEGEKATLLGERPVLEWFDGRYARCFVALHPFFRIPGMDPAQCMHGPLILEASDMPEGANFLEWNEEQYQNQLANKIFDSEAVDEAARLYGEPVSWHEICGEAGFSDHHALEVALLSCKHALIARYHDAKGVRRIEDYCAREKIFLPTDNEFQHSMQRGICALLDAYKAKRAIMEDEFGFAKEIVSLSYLQECGISPAGGAPEAYNPTRISTEDRALHICVEFDCFFALIFEQDDRLPKATIGNLFEGFWCMADTSLAWRRQPVQPLTAGGYDGSSKGR